MGDLAPGPSVALDIEITIACDDWLRSCANAAAKVEIAARLAFEHAATSTRLAPTERVIVGITLADDTEQHRLNRTYRGKDAPTNVLAFPGADLTRRPPIGAPLLLGDIVLALETVRCEAVEQQKPLADHLRHLVVHGVLHLLGYDHDEKEAAAVMERREIEILAQLGVPDPYRDII